MTLNDWKNLSITQEIMDEFRKRQAFAKEYLASNAGIDSGQDRWYSGTIAAYEDMLNVELENEESHKID